MINHSTSGRSTTNLVEAARIDSEAFSLLVRSYERASVGVAYAILGDAAMASDVSQRAFIRAWQRLNDLHDSARFGSWLLRIVRNLALDSRRTIHHFEPLSDLVLNHHNHPWISDPREQMLRREQFDMIAAALFTLNEHSRIALVLRYYDDLSSDEIAQVLNTTSHAVNTTLFRARRRLKVLLFHFMTDERTSADAT